MKNLLSLIPALALAAGCAEYSSKPSTVLLPTSNKSIDVVMHRSDVRFSDCGTLTVLQTFDADARLIDAKEARGQAFHCTLIPALIDAGGRVGAGAVVRPARTTINNAVNAAAGATAGSTSTSNSGASATATGTGGSATATGGNSTATGGQGGNGGNGGQGGSNGNAGEQGNNGGGNGNGDGTNPGTDHHHDNGDNN